VKIKGGIEERQMRESWFAVAGGPLLAEACSGRYRKEAAGEQRSPYQVPAEVEERVRAEFEAIMRQNKKEDVA
jgi:hypothetical protein